MRVAESWSQPCAASVSAALPPGGTAEALPAKTSSAPVRPARDRQSRAIRKIWVSPDRRPTASQRSEWHDATTAATAQSARRMTRPWNGSIACVPATAFPQTSPVPSPQVLQLSARPELRVQSTEGHGVGIFTFQTDSVTKCSAVTERLGTGCGPISDFNCALTSSLYLAKSALDLRRDSSN